MKKLIYGLLIALLIVTGIMVYNNKDKFSRDSYTPGVSNKNSSSSHSCYVCGEKGNLKYGSHYYCSTHWAMVKTVAEAG